MRFKEFYEADWSFKDRRAPEFDSTLAQRQHRIEYALRQLMERRGSGQIRVLDASCGNGSFLRFFCDCGVQVIAADISVNAIKRAKRENPSVRFVAASAEEGLPFAGAAFDLVWFGETLAHLFDGHNALSEFNRVLKDDGRLIVTTPYHGRIKNLAIVLFGFHNHFYSDNYRIRFYDRTSLASSLRWAGFEPLSWSGIGRFWPVWKSFFVVATKNGPPGSAPDRQGPR